MEHHGERAGHGLICVNGVLSDHLSPRFSLPLRTPVLPMVPTGSRQHKLEDKKEVARLVETLALGSVGESTQKNYKGEWNVWVSGRKSQGKGPWLHFDPADPNRALSELMELIACRCYVHNNQQSTVRGYLAAIKFFHKMYAGWDLPTSHRMIVAVGKGIDRA